MIVPHLFLVENMGHSKGFRYKKLVEINSPGDCWKWIGSVSKKTGYGKKQFSGQTWLAHRWVWTMLFGKIPENHNIDHICSNRVCVNPHHLRIATQKQNARSGKGTKLNVKEAEEIRSIEKKWGDRKEIAKKYKVSEQTISDIRANRSWN